MLSLLNLNTMLLTRLSLLALVISFADFASVYDRDGFHLHSNTMAKPNHEADWVQLAKEHLKKAKEYKQNVGVAKNLILFIGDGMGVSTMTAARWMKAQLREENIESHTVKMSWDEFLDTGVAKTYCTDQITADSGATANAFACGIKSRSGVIGVNQYAVRGECGTVAGNEVDSMVTKANRNGKWTGVISTARITHATPAAAYSHSADRNWESDQDVPEDDRDTCRDIAYQLVHNDGNEDIHVILGGGRREFLPATTVDPEYNDIQGTRLDNRNLIEDWQQKHESSPYVDKLLDFENVNPAETDFLFGLFEPSHMQYEADRENDVWGEPSLAEMVEKSIEILRRNDDGFVLYVEGGRVDHAHHDTNAYRALKETLALEEAVAKAREMTSDEDTLIVVTADHSHSFTINGYPHIENDILGVSEREPGVPHLGDDGMPYLAVSYTNGPGAHTHRPEGGQRSDLRVENIPPTKDDAENRTSYRQDAGIPIYSETHAGEDVLVYAIGPMAHLLTGVYEQSYIPHAMMYAACIGEFTDDCDDRGNSVGNTAVVQIPLAMTSLLSLVFTLMA